MVNVVTKIDIGIHYRCFLAIHNTQTETYQDLIHVNGKFNQYPHTEDSTFTE